MTMAEASALCFSRLRFSSSSSSSSAPSISRCGSFHRIPLFNSSFNFSIPRPSSSRLQHHPIVVKANNSSSNDQSNLSGDDPFGFFPWSQSDTEEVCDGQTYLKGCYDFGSLNLSSHKELGLGRTKAMAGEIQWVHEDRITLFTADGLMQIGGSMVPRRVSSSDKKQGKFKTSQKCQRFQESDYMDPNQGLCLGALFDIAATNGLDMGRRLCIFGFCRSIEMLSNVVEDTVLEHGGEVIAAEKASKGDLHEKLTMTVAVPLLWGVPPASETLHLAVKSGGGIVEKVYWQWDFL